MSPRDELSGPRRPAPLARPGLETLEAAYAQWEALERDQAEARRRWSERAQQLTQQGRFLLGTVRSADAAAPPEPQGLVAPGALNDFLQTAQRGLESALEALRAERARGEADFAAALASAQALIRERVERTLATVKPRFTLRLRPLPGERAILHVDRLSPDEAVLALVLLTGQVPTRYGFLFDDATDDAALPPPSLYPEEGSELQRPEAPALGARVRAPGGALPVKGLLPVWVVDAQGEQLFRLLQRGPVMELEVAEGAGFRNVLSLSEAERFSGHLLRLKLAGRIELEMETG